MAIYEYKCEPCNAVTERVQSMHAPRPDTILCKYCGQEAKFAISLVSIPTAGMSNSPLDVSIGRDAEAKWARIHENTEIRNKVRRETNTQGLTATSPTTFAPISRGQKALRTRVLDQVAKDGYKPDSSDPMSKLVNK